MVKIGQIYRILAHTMEGYAMVNPPVKLPTVFLRRWRWASGPMTRRQTIGNNGTQSLRLNRHGDVRSSAVMLVRLRSGKPLETVGRKTRG